MPEQKEQSIWERWEEFKKETLKSGTIIEVDDVCKCPAELLEQMFKQFFNTELKKIRNDLVGKEYKMKLETTSQDADSNYIRRGYNTKRKEIISYFNKLIK